MKAEADRSYTFVYKNVKILAYYDDDENLWELYAKRDRYGFRYMFGLPGYEQIENVLDIAKGYIDEYYITIFEEE